MKINKLLTKKTAVTVLGVAAILAAGGVFPPATAAIVTKCVAVIVAAFNIGQGFSDGMTDGKTATHKPPIYNGTETD